MMRRPGSALRTFSSMCTQAFSAPNRARFERLSRCALTRSLVRTAPVRTLIYVCMHVHPGSNRS